MVGTVGGGVAVTGISVLSTALPAFFHLSVMWATLLSSVDPTNFCKRVLTFASLRFSLRALRHDSWYCASLWPPNHLVAPNLVGVKGFRGSGYGLTDVPERLFYIIINFGFC